MKWYVIAFVISVLGSIALGVNETMRTPNSEISIIVIKWVAIGAAAFLCSCLVLATGCGAPGRARH